jgi:hypothetical protein
VTGYDPKIPAIRTRLNDVLYASKTEAQWVIFFNEMGLRFEYEPAYFTLPGGIVYRPDFWLPQVKWFAEVKPFDGDQTEFRRKTKALVQDTGEAILLLDGPPALHAYAGLQRMNGEFRGEVEESEYSLDIEKFSDVFARGRLFSDPYYIFMPGITLADRKFAFSGRYIDAVEFATARERFK